MKLRTIAACAALLVSTAAMAQELAHSPHRVSLEPPEITTIDRGHPGTVELQFRVARGFHINSNQPKQEYLKKTELHLDAPTDIVIGRITYPDGEDRSFPFAPNDKLNVYSGDFAVDVVVRPLSTVLPTKYAVHGYLKYQACDNAACYPPKQLPVSFEVKIVKDRTQHRRNPAQSPHVHS
ncbi:MAG TPA: protein-disulfide reductase DsbD domain-containing protein [Terriglobales bacterium]|nr:protein-disulfide reductase DsbD domain-containing protein [Terriglobales bacterium]